VETSSATPPPESQEEALAAVGEGGAHPLECREEGAMVESVTLMRSSPSMGVDEGGNRAHPVAPEGAPVGVAGWEGGVAVVGGVTELKIAELEGWSASGGTDGIAEAGDGDTEPGEASPEQNSSSEAEDGSLTLQPSSTAVSLDHGYAKLGAGLPLPTAVTAEEAAPAPSMPADSPAETSEGVGAHGAGVGSLRLGSEMMSGGREWSSHRSSALSLEERGGGTAHPEVQVESPRSHRRRNQGPRNGLHRLAQSCEPAGDGGGGPLEQKTAAHWVKGRGGREIPEVGQFLPPPPPPPHTNTHTYRIMKCPLGAWKSQIIIEISRKCIQTHECTS